MFDIITIGSATRDVFLTSRAMHPHRAKDVLTHIEACFPFGAKINIDDIHFDTGGGATNNAVTFARLGKLRVAALCRVGADSAGHDVLNALKHNRVDTSLVQTARGEQTAYSTIISPGGEVGERTILVYRGASERFNHSRLPWQKMKARWFYISSLGGDLALLKKILAHAKKIGAKVAWNPGGAELSQLNKEARPPSDRRSGLRIFNQLAFLILNREESAQLTGVRFSDTKELLRVLAALVTTKGVIMTDGPKGAYAVLRYREDGPQSRRRTVLRTSAYYIPSVGHKPKNLTGAGDAFGSGFITGWLKSNGDIQYALRLASFNADSVVQHIGAKVGILEKIPPKNKLQKLLVREMQIDK